LGGNHGSEHLNLFQNLIQNHNIESYIFQPSTWEELISALFEIQDFLELKKEENTFTSKTTLIINNWQGLLYLFNRAVSVNNFNFNNLLLQLKFLSDKCNIVLLNNLNNKDLNLYSWAQEILELIDKYSAEVKKTTMPERSQGLIISFLQNQKNNINPEINNNYFINSIQSFNTAKIQENPEIPEKINNLNTTQIQEIPEKSILSSSISEKSDIYNNLMQQLSNAQSRQDLLIIRKEIQSFGDSLSAREKIGLSDIYKIHLQRIKLLEDSFLGAN